MSYVDHADDARAARDDIAAMVDGPVADPVDIAALRRAVDRLAQAQAGLDLED